MTRAYIRVDPAFYERKLEQGYPLPAIGALAGCLCLAELQPLRGRFRDVNVLKALLGPEGAKQVAYLLERGDLVYEGSRIYVDGWDEWQEGDVTVKERMQRVRNRKHGNASNRNERDGSDRNAGDDSDRNLTVLAGRGGADSGAGQPARYSDAFKAFEQCQRHKADATEKKWINELCRDFGRERVSATFYADADPDKPGLLGRVSKVLRKGAA